MLRAGLSYNDWRMMAHFQRQDWLARWTLAAQKIKHQLESSEGADGLLHAVITRLLGF